MLAWYFSAPGLTLPAHWGVDERWETSANWRFRRMRGRWALASILAIVGKNAAFWAESHGAAVANSI
jgi:hypothetical protein